MIAYEKNGKLAVMPGTNLVPENVSEAQGMRVFNDAGTKKALIGAETDLMAAPTPEPTQGGQS